MRSTQGQPQAWQGPQKSPAEPGYIISFLMVLAGVVKLVEAARDPVIVIIDI